MQLPDLKVCSVISRNFNSFYI